MIFFADIDSTLSLILQIITALGILLTALRSHLNGQQAKKQHAENKEGLENVKHAVNGTVSKFVEATQVQTDKAVELAKESAAVATAAAYAEGKKDQRPVEPVIAEVRVVNPPTDPVHTVVLPSPQEVEDARPKLFRPGNGPP